MHSHAVGMQKLRALVLTTSHLVKLTAQNFLQVKNIMSEIRFKISGNHFSNTLQIHGCFLFFLKLIIKCHEQYNTSFLVTRASRNLT